MKIQVTDDDDIPNKKYVDVQIAAQVAPRLTSQKLEMEVQVYQAVVADFESFLHQCGGYYS